MGLFYAATSGCFFIAVGRKLQVRLAFQEEFYRKGDKDNDFYFGYVIFSDLNLYLHLVL